MTCIVAVSRGGRVVLGGDRAISEESGLLTRTAVAKIFRVGDVLCGIAGASRPGDIIQDALLLNYTGNRLSLKALRRCIVPLIRNALGAAGYLWTPETTNDEHDLQIWQLIMATTYGIFEITETLEVHQVYDSYHAIGSGDKIAYGALYASSAKTALKATKTALRAAARFDASVRGPFDFLEL